jgi:hypothetical protein
MFGSTVNMPSFCAVGTLSFTKNRSVRKYILVRENIYIEMQVDKQGVGS